MIVGGRADLEATPSGWCSLPATAIFLTVLALNFLGDVIRARFDVREAAMTVTGALEDASDGPLLEVDRTSRPTSSTPEGRTRGRRRVVHPRAGPDVLGLVGESGSGKSVLADSIMGLLPQRGVVRARLDPVRRPGDRGARTEGDAARCGARRWRWCSKTR